MSQTLAITASPAMFAAVPLASAPGREKGRVRIVADDRALLLFGLKKVALTLLTLGIYHFWGRAEARRRIYQAITIDGHALSWTGTGRRSFCNFAIAVLVASPGLWAVGSYAATNLNLGGLEFRWPEGILMRRIFIGTPLMFLVGSAIYRRRAHLLRNSWAGGFSFAMSGRAWAYAGTHFWTSLIALPTLGWAVPWRTEKLAHRMAREQAYAGIPFAYAPDWHALVRPYAWAWAASAGVYMAMMVALVLALGPELAQFSQTRSPAVLASQGAVSRGGPIIAAAFAMFYLIAKAWYAHVLRHQAERTSIGEVRFSLRLPIAGYALMTASNLVLRIASLGILTPWCEARHWRFLLRHLVVHGALPQPQIRPA